MAPAMLFRFFFLMTILGLSGRTASGQVTALFTMPDTVCVNVPVIIANTSTNATTYSWNFCRPDATTPATSVALGTFNNKLELSVYMDYVFVNGNYYGFVVNNTPGGLVRLDFGNSLMNTPTAVALGNFNGVLVKSAMGIQLVQNNGRWYAIMLCGDDGVQPPTTPRILKIDFGADITNQSPTVTNWGNIGGLAYAHELYLFQDASLNWYGITNNLRTNSLTRFSFGANFDNPPVGVNLGTLGQLNGPVGLFPVNDNGVWRVFVTNFFNHTLTRVDFGNSLLNPPSAVVNLGNPGGMLNLPRDIVVFASCGESIGYLLNDDGTVVRLAFRDLTTTPTANKLPKVVDDAVSFSKIFRQGDEVYSFIPNYIPTGLSRIQFPSCTATSIQGSQQQLPPAFSYNTPGKYYVTLRVDDGLPTETAFCKQIVATAPIPVSVSNDLSICPGDSAQLTTTGGQAGTFAWTPTTGLSDPSAASPRAAPAVSTQYIVQSGTQGCVTKDTVAVTVISVSANSFAIAPGNAAVCAGEPVTLTASGGNAYQWVGNASGTANTVSVTPSATTQYGVRIQNSNNNCSVVDTLYTTVTVKPPPVVTATKSGDIDCVTLQVALQASGATQYQWSPATGLSSAGIANPMAGVTQSTLYTVVGKGADGCSATDTITVQVLNTGSPVYHMPNSFTPNNDGLNDCFGVKNWGGISHFSFSVYHRSGSIIFSTTDPLKCWNGTIKGTLAPPGTYVYLIKAVTVCGEVEKYGTVTLIR